MRYHPAERLFAHGLELTAPESVLVAEDVDLERVARTGVSLGPNVRIEGAGTVIDAGVRVGELGPVVLVDCALGRGARVLRGSAEGAVLLDGATLGPDAHVRPASLLEEGASTAHAVGLKHTFLLAFATVGSNANVCDCLLGGGRDRDDHSEIGSGFIHFNFTPFGARGDKATASLFGSVPRSVLLNENRIFLGGAGGVVGPLRVGFGTVLAAGSVYRRDQAEDRLVYAATLPERSVAFDPHEIRGAARRLDRTAAYVGELWALDAWYREVRLPRAPAGLARLVLEQARGAIAAGVQERVRQGDRLAENLRTAARTRAVGEGETYAEIARAWAERRERLLEPPSIATGDEDLDRVRAALGEPGDHVAWTRTLAAETQEAVRRWLGALVVAVAGDEVGSA